jgi:hypothetical protein
MAFREYRPFLGVLLSLQDYLSVCAVSLRIFWGTVAALSYMSWQFSRRRIFKF